MPIPDAIVDFIYDKLEEYAKRGEKEFPKAIYFFYNRYLCGIQKPGNDAPAAEQAEWKQFEQSMRSFSSFLNNLNTEELFRYLQSKIPGLKLFGPGSENKQLAITQMFSSILEDLRPETMLQRNLEEVQMNPEVLAFTQRFWNLGARIYVTEGMRDLVYRDETVISLRNRMQEIAPVLKASLNFVENEVRRALLALAILEPQNGKAENVAKWQAIQAKIKQKLAFIREDLIQERIPRVQDLSEQLSEILRDREGNLLGLEQADFMGSELSRLRKKATGVCETSESQIKNIQELSNMFDLISTTVEQCIGMRTSAGPGAEAAAAAVTNEIGSFKVLTASIRELATRFGWGSPEYLVLAHDCATQLARSLLSPEFNEQDKVREFKRVQDIIANSRNLTVSLLPFPKLFTMF